MSQKFEVGEKVEVTSRSDIWGVLLEDKWIGTVKSIENGLYRVVDEDGIEHWNIQERFVAKVK